MLYPKDRAINLISKANRISKADLKDQNRWTFSKSQLKLLLAVHLIPINRVIFPWSHREYSS
jgi:hypothetical protein